MTCGCAALASAFARHGVRHVFGVAGQPVTHCAVILDDSNPGFEWALNEKVAVESAVGLSAVGVRSAVLIKQAGLNVAFDPLVNAVYHSIGAGLVVVVGDEVGATASTCEQDSRFLAVAAGLPVLEPVAADEVDAVLGTAYAVSEEAATPVLVRILTRLHQDGPAAGEAPPAAAAGLTRGRRRPDPAVAFALTKLGRQQHRRLREGVVVDAVRHLALDRTCQRPCGSAVLAVGAAAAHLPRGRQRCVAVTRVSWPLPSEVLQFVVDHEDVLLLEEPRGFLEQQLRAHLALAAGNTTRLRGRLSGHLPPEGGLNATLVAACDVLPASGRTWEEVTVKPVAGCVPPPYDVLFKAVAQRRRAGTFVAVDVGSSVRLCYPPTKAPTSRCASARPSP